MAEVKNKEMSQQTTYKDDNDANEQKWTYAGLHRLFGTGNLKEKYGMQEVLPI